MVKIYPMKDETMLDLQTAYLGQNMMIEHDLCQGQPVIIKLGKKSSIISRVFLHPVSQVNYIELSTFVTSNCENKRNIFYSDQDVEFIKVAETVADCVKVKIVKLPSFRKRNMRKILHKCLNNYLLTNSCDVTFSAELQKLYGIESVHLNSNISSAFVLGQETKIIIESVISKHRRDLLKNQKEAAESEKLGGVKSYYDDLKEALSCHFNVFLSGAAGCGKTSLLTKVCADLQLPQYLLDCSALASPDPGASESVLRDNWLQMISEGGGVLVLDNIDCIATGKGSGNRIFSQLVAILDESRDIPLATIVGVSTQPQLIDVACRRYGRLETEIDIKTPNLEQRLDMISALCCTYNVTLLDEVMIEAAKTTAGFLVSDLALLIRKLAQLSRDKSQLDMEIVEKEIVNSRPAQLKSGIGCVNINSVSMNTLGGLQEVKSKLLRAIQLPLTNPESFSRLGIKPCKGVLLSGPPGCGKTSLVRAIASSCQVSFLSVSLAEIFSPYVGDSEKSLLEVFTKARKAAPAILFIDEIETFVSSRDSNQTQSSSDKLLATLLTEMDGLAGELGGRVVLVGATNRPEILDSALTRPGRFDVHISVPLPNALEREDILQTVMRDVPHENFEMSKIANLTEGYTGADIECLVREASLLSLMDDMQSSKLDQHYLEKILLQS